MSVVTEFRCPSCNQRLAADSRALGRTVICQRCEHSFRPIDAIDRDVVVPVVTADERLPEDTKGKGGGEPMRASTKRGPLPLRLPEPEPLAARSVQAEQAPVGPSAAPKAPARQDSAMWFGAAASVARALAGQEAQIGSASGAQGSAPLGVARAGPLLRAARARADAPVASPAPLVRPSGDEDRSADAAAAEPDSPWPPGLDAAPPVVSRSNGPAAVSAPQAAAAAELGDLAAASTHPEPAGGPTSPVSEADGVGSRGRAPSARPRRRATTLVELSAAAQRTLEATDRRVPVRHVMLAITTVTPMLLLAMALTGGVARWLFGVLSALALGSLLAFHGVRQLPRIAARLGPVELPGSAPVWLASSAGALTLVAGLLTWGLSAASVSLVAVAGMPEPPKAAVSSRPPPEPPAEAADSKLQRAGHLQVGPGVLYVPATFSSPDGAFDLVLHLHGNPALVEKSVEAAGLNALVHVTNLGESSDPYDRHFVVPTAFADLLERIEAKAAKLGLRDAHVRRIALSSWSAGYGGTSRILQSDSNVARIDALLIHDGLHLGYADPKTETIDPRLLAPYTAFARRAAKGEKLFVITHSDVRPHGYAAASETADAILAVVAGTRRPLEPGKDSPPHVEFDEALKAMPQASRRWLEARSTASAGSFFVLGYGGDTPEDHMAHLVQMSVTTLPRLAQRWSAPVVDAGAPDGG